MPEHSERRTLTFREAADRALSWLVAGLVAWLCYSTLALRDGQAQQMAQLAVIIDRQDRNKEDLAQLRLADTTMQGEISELQKNFNNHLITDRKSYNKVEPNYKMEGRH